MSCKIIKERERAIHVEYELEFWNDEQGGGYGFPCDKDGNVFDDIADCAKENLAWCLEHPERFDVFKKVRKNSWTYTEPAVAKCHCGEEFQLVDEYMGACECPKCHQWYNLFCQEVLPPEEWEENIEEDY